MAVTADKVITIAKGYVGYHEKASGKSLESKAANSGSANYTKFNKYMHRIQPSNMDYPAAWCDAFVDYCVLEAAGFDKSKAKHVLCGDFDDYTVRSAQLYINAGRYDKKPKRGDQVFFKNSSGICHTGLVTEVTTLMVHTVEGNSGNAVKTHSYLKTSPRIAGYGHPRYDSAKPKPSTPSTPAKKTVAQVAAEVIDGKWGTGEDRKKRLKAAGYDPAEVQAKVNEMLKVSKPKPEAFPLPAGHWYGVQQQDRRAHSGYTVAGERPAIKKIQKVVGVTQDGYYGPVTMSAVKKYQKAHKLTADGEVGIKTWTEMFK